MGGELTGAEIKQVYRMLEAGEIVREGEGLAATIRLKKESA